jgi:RNA polymerase sigma-70 factor (ECF subfamily)
MGDFEDIYSRHAGAVLRYAWRLVGRREIAEELAADAFLSLYEHMATIDVAQLPAWLFTAVRNRAIDYWRRQAVEGRYRNTLPEEPTTPAHQTELELLDHKALKPVHRLCLRLRYGYGMSIAEIARETGLSETQAKGHLQYGRQILRRELIKESP